MPWWGWALLGWVAFSVLLAPVIGLALREAERRDSWTARTAVTDQAPRAAVRARRRRIPVPPVTAGLLITGIGLEAVGFVVRTSGNERGAGRLWSMDLPSSVPRLFVAGLFAAAALAALLGATRATGRRSWWLAVGLVAVVVAQVKAGGTVHVRALETLGMADRPVLALLVSAVVAGGVLVGLWWLSRGDRRDRRRVLGALSIYAVAAVGLSGVSSLVGRAGASAWWQAAATFVEESVEVGGAVAVLTAVLIGVAPRLVLPAEWALRRRADAETIDVPAPARRPGDLRL